MSHSNTVVAFRPPDEKWEAMKAVRESCVAAGIAVPKEVEKFFDWKEPDERGVEIRSDALQKSGALRDWKDEFHEGYEVDVKKLPADVTVIRFFCGW